MNRFHPLLKRTLSFLTVLTLAFFLGACGDDIDEEAEPLGEADPGEVVEDTDVDRVVYFTDWDTNDDTYLTETEFATGMETTTLWEDWDVDDDTYLTQDEFDTAFGEYGWYDATYWDTWDADNDNLLSEDEYHRGLYNTWDADQNQMLYEDEFDEGLF